MQKAAPSQRDIRRARRLNPYYKKRLRWSAPDGWPDDAASTVFARRVAAFQAEHGGLAVDGILGPKTWAAIEGNDLGAAGRRPSHRCG